MLLQDWGWYAGWCCISMCRYQQYNLLLMTQDVIRKHEAIELGRSESMRKAWSEVTTMWEITTDRENKHDTFTTGVLQGCDCHHAELSPWLHPALYGEPILSFRRGVAKFLWSQKPICCCHSTDSGLTSISFWTWKTMLLEDALPLSLVVSSVFGESLTSLLSLLEYS